MKKAISIALILMLVLSMALTACSGGSDDNSDDGADGADGTKWAIVYSTNLGDLSFNDSSKKGLDSIAAENDDFSFDYFECSSDATKYEPAFIDYADSGNYSLIWSSSNSLREACEVVAAMFPEQKFGLYDTQAQNPADNTYSMTYKQNDGSYLVGLVAAYITETDVIGCVGGEDIDVINDFFVGYIQGAQAVNPDIKVASSFVTNFQDIAKAKELTLAQFNQGADVCYQVASGAGQGVIQACAQEGKWAIGVDSDQAAMYEETDPEMSAAIITSMLKNVGDSIVLAYEKFVAEEINWGGNDALGIAEGGVGYVINDTFKANLSEEQQQAIIDAKDEVVAGNVTVDTVYGKEAGWMADLRNEVMPS